MWFLKTIHHCEAFSISISNWFSLRKISFRHFTGLEKYNSNRIICSVLNMKIVRHFAGGVGGDFGRRCHKF